MTLADELKAMEGRLSEKRATHHAQSCRYVSPRGKRGPKILYGRGLEMFGYESRAKVVECQENKASSVDRDDTLK